MSQDDAHELEDDAPDLKLRFADDVKPRKIAGAVDRRFRRDFDLLAISVERSGHTVMIVRGMWYILGIDAVAELLAHEFPAT
jgi:hypothetical protein